MTELDSIAWYYESACAGTSPLGYTPKFCTFCGAQLQHKTGRLPKSLWNFDPRTGEQITETYTEHKLACPKGHDVYRGIEP